MSTSKRLRISRASPSSSDESARLFNFIDFIFSLRNLYPLGLGLELTKMHELSREVLNEMYSQQKMSSPQIARIQKCTPEYIRLLLRKYGIRIRTKSESRRLLFNLHIPKSQLEFLYQTKKLSSPEIAEKFGCSAGFIRNRLKEYDIPLRSYKEALALSNVSSHPQKNFNGSLEKKLTLWALRRAICGSTQRVN